MGSGESTGKKNKDEKKEPPRRCTREEILKALTVTVTTDAKGNEVVKSELLDLLNSGKKTAGSEFTWASIYDPNDPDKDECTKKALGETPFTDPSEDRSFGALFGLVVGDSMGSRLEFFPVDYEANDVKDMGEGRGGKFQLLPGQWTDDTSQALCVADTLLTKGGFEPHDMMHRILSWWFCGYNNSGRFEEEGEAYRHSFGLGGLMKMAINSYLSHPVAATVAGTKESCGNGSLMRLAPVPIFFRNDIEQAEKIAEQQSYLTHQGIEAAECCRLMAHIMVRCLAGEELRAVLDSLPTSFKTECPSVRALADSKAEKLVVKPSEGGDDSKTSGDQIDPDRNWNWKADDFRYSPKRVESNPGYIGSYAMDGLAMALHILWKTSSLPEALLKAVNLRGDADTLAAIVGQIGGCYYGCNSIPVEWKKTVMQWDNHEIALRAYRLHNHKLLQ